MTTSSSRQVQLPELLSAIENIDRSSFTGADDDRAAALSAARALCARLETPREALLQMILEAPSLCAATKTGFDMGLFKALDTRSEKPKSSAKLAEICGGDQVLVSRLLKHLSAANLVSEVGPDLYEATLFTSSLQHRSHNSNLDYFYDMATPMFTALPEYLQKTNYQNPVNPVDGPWQHATNSKDHLFAWLGAHPKEAKNFSDVMSGFTSSKQNWTEIFPVEEVLKDKTDGILVVDVGGNTGSDQVSLIKNHPEVKERVVVQDLEHVLQNVEQIEGVTYMPHDFFTPQPIHGARIYFLHAVLHDWIDEDCLRILGGLKPAFGQGSRLLINEIVIPSTGANLLTTSMDLTMMACLSTHERTEENWTKLLTKAGFAVTKIHKGRFESVIEATVG